MSGVSSVERVEKQLEDVKKEIANKETEVKRLEEKIAECDIKLIKAKGDEKAEVEVVKKLAEKQLKKAEAELKELKAIRDGLYQSLDKVAIETEKARAEEAKAKAETEKAKAAHSQQVGLELEKRVEGLVEWKRQETRKRKFGEFSELSTLAESEVELVEVTGGTLSDHDHKLAHYALNDRYTNWDFCVDDLDEVEMKASDYGFKELPALFDRAGSDLRIISIEKAQHWGLGGSSSFVDHHDSQKLVSWRSARPDFIIVHSSATLVTDKLDSSTVLKSEAPLIFVEVQSGGKDEKYGMTHLRMALVGAHTVKARTYYGLFIGKGDYLGSAHLVRIDSTGTIWIDGEYSIAKVPALCKKLLDSETELTLP
eukprot:TRINITY_DN371_c0_g1_i2.p1 TRINITY_DN371_c0_g1~~TRINITY_DN371_c0_g1_i2.p1  ORF type:complete len:386 (+),score=85.40 TRINITY_DN371_c0_g1_i2:54-1160(+)